MSEQHTQGRLHVAGQDKVQIRSDKHQIAKAWSFAGKTGQENARRLVACWNACEGISTDELETTGGAAVGWTRTASKLIHATTQRDELLAALKLARGALRQAATDVSDWGAYAPAHFQTKHKLADDVQAYNNAADSAHAAITKMEGGGV